MPTRPDPFTAAFGTSRRGATSTKTPLTAGERVRVNATRPDLQNAVGVVHSVRPGVVSVRLRQVIAITDFSPSELDRDLTRDMCVVPESFDGPKAKPKAAPACDDGPSGQKKAKPASKEQSKADTPAMAASSVSGVTS